ncbi:hypothetical protein BC831DRAFT_459868, partial [Entophlyctis helioformis]
MDDSDTAQPYWAPVAGWEKRWVLPRPSPQNSIVATLGARPSNTSKPPPNHYRVCKWVRVPGKAMPSLKDEGATPVPAEAAAVDADVAMSVEPATAEAADAADEAGSASVQATLEPQHNHKNHRNHKKHNQMWQCKTRHRSNNSSNSNSNSNKNSQGRLIPSN